MLRAFVTFFGIVHSVFVVVVVVVVVVLHTACTLRACMQCMRMCERVSLALSRFHLFFMHAWCLHTSHLDVPPPFFCLYYSFTQCGYINAKIETNK
mmetsp:Transcript_49373/g.127282  ORF Transcript_49373/g.127282 Transcript_49373/m.127282 type:complete len:96 (-) Transcript_49373:78-365(-)